MIYVALWLAACLFTTGEGTLCFQSCDLQIKKWIGNGICDTGCQDCPTYTTNGVFDGGDCGPDWGKPRSTTTTTPYPVKPGSNCLPFTKSGCNKYGMRWDRVGVSHVARDKREEACLIECRIRMAKGAEDACCEWEEEIQACTISFEQKRHSLPDWKNVKASNCWSDYQCEDNMNADGIGPIYRLTFAQCEEKFTALGKKFKYYAPSSHCQETLEWNRKVNNGWMTCYRKGTSEAEKAVADMNVAYFVACSDEDKSKGCYTYVYGVNLCMCPTAGKASAITMVNSSGSETAVHVFAAVGLAFLLYGAFRHYYK